MKSLNRMIFFAVAIYIAIALMMFTFAAAFLVADDAGRETELRICFTFFFAAGVIVVLLAIDLVGDLFANKAADQIHKMELKKEASVGKEELEAEIDEQFIEEEEVEEEMEPLTPEQVQELAALAEERAAEEPK